MPQQAEPNTDALAIDNAFHSLHSASAATRQNVSTHSPRPDHQHDLLERTGHSALSLAWLLDPATPRTFYEVHYEREPLWVARNQVDYFVGLPCLEDVDGLLNTTVSNHVRPLDGDRLTRSERDGSSSEQRFRASRYGVLDVQSVYRSYHDGFTAVINQMNRRSAAVSRLCRSLQAELHHPVGANLYLTPAHAQGFRPHVDMHDVFILQLHGTKEWHVSSPSTELPLVSAQHYKQNLPDFQTYVLAPGDTLYLPRGFRHEAVTGDSSSLHLTVGVHAFRWHDLLSDVLALVAEEDVTFRGALPAGYLHGSLDMDRVEHMARRLSMALADRELVEKAKQRIASKLIAADAAVGLSRFRSLDSIVAMTGRSIVARPPEVLCLTRVTPEQATIEFLGNFVTGPRVIAPALQFIAQNHQFAVSDLPGNLSDHDRIDLVKRLVTEGLLEVLNP